MPIDSTLSLGPRITGWFGKPMEKQRHFIAHAHRDGLELGKCHHLQHGTSPVDIFSGGRSWEGSYLWKYVLKSYVANVDIGINET